MSEENNNSNPKGNNSLAASKPRPRVTLTDAIEDPKGNNPLASSKPRPRVMRTNVANDDKFVTKKQTDKKITPKK